MHQEAELELLTEELRRSGEPQAVIAMEDIHPAMTIVDRQRALEEIMRVLRGEE